MNAIMFLATLKGRLSVIGAMILAVVGLRIWDVNHQRSIGWKDHAAKVEKVTNADVSNANSAGNKSADPNSRGVRNPYYR